MTNQNWNDDARNMIKGLIASKGLSVDELVKRLAAIGIQDTARGVYGKLHRGTFSFVFFLQVLKALNIEMNFRSEERRVGKECRL